MFIFQSNTSKGISILYPLLPRSRGGFTAVELSSMLRIAPLLIILEALLCIFMLNLLLNPEIVPKMAALASASFFALLALRLLLRKGVKVANDPAELIGPAPQITWVEHILFCLAGSLGGFLNAALTQLPMLGLNVHSMIGMAFFFGAILPFLNVLVVHLKNR